VWHELLKRLPIGGLKRQSKNLVKETLNVLRGLEHATHSFELPGSVTESGGVGTKWDCRVVSRINWWSVYKIANNLSYSLLLASGDSLQHEHDSHISISRWRRFRLDADTILMTSQITLLADNSLLFSFVCWNTNAGCKHNGNSFTWI
jgi:hypothetical protein